MSAPTEYRATLRSLVGVRVAERVASVYETPRQLANAGEGELTERYGARAAARIMAAFALARGATAQPLDVGDPIRSSARVVAAFAPRLEALLTEEVWCVMTDAGNRPRREVRVAVGGVASCAVDVQGILIAALREGARGLVLIHNHPTGDPTPSDEDRQLTGAVARGAAAVGLSLLDHVVIGSRGRAFSFLDAGIMPRVDRAL